MIAIINQVESGYTLNQKRHLKHSVEQVYADGE